MTGSRTEPRRAVAAGPDAPRAFAERLQAEARAQLNVRIAVDVLGPGELPHTVHKAKRIVRRWSAVGQQF